VDELIRTAMRERRLVEFWLHGLRRVGEPHVYGIHRGVRQLLLYQVAGETRSGGLPDWRRADLPEVSQLRILDEKFPGARLAMSRHRGWDVVLERVH
jgi:hypothetical protein